MKKFVVEIETSGELDYPVVHHLEGCPLCRYSNSLWLRQLDRGWLENEVMNHLLLVHLVRPSVIEFSYVPRS